MKQAIIIIFAWIGMFSVSFGFAWWIVDPGPHYDFPEELKAVSHCNEHPDTLTVYQQDGTFYLQFKRKAPGKQ